MIYSETYRDLGISENEFNLIKDIVENFSGNNISIGLSMLLKIFGGEIRPRHFICLGILIGQIEATDKMLLQNKNNFLCLKQN